MPKKYEIKWVIDDAQARGVFARGVKGMKDIEAAALGAGTALESAMAKGAVKGQAAMTASASSGAVRRKKIADDEKVHIDFGLHKLQVSGVKYQEQMTRGMQTESAKRRRLLDAEARYQESSALGPAGRLAQIKRRALSDDILGAAAYNRHMDAYHQKRIMQIQKQRYGTSSAFVEAIGQAIGLGSAMTAAGAAAAGAGAIVAGLGLISEGYHKIRAEAEAAAAATSTLVKGLRMESTLKGYAGMGTQALTEALAFRTATGLPADQASDLTRQYLGSLPIGLEKGNITPEVANALMTQVGITQAWQGGDAGTRGDLAGVLGQFSKIGTVEAGLGQMEAIRQGLTAGRGDDPVLTAQLLKTAGSIVREGGSVGSLPEMAALIGATSLSGGPEQAGTRAEHLNRALKGGLLRHTKRKGAIMSQADYMKSLGITEKTDMEGFLGAIVPDVMKAKAAGRDVESYLGEHGLSNSEERRAVMEMVPLYDAVKSRMERARGAQDGSKILEANKRFLQSTSGQEAVAEQLADVQTVTKGLPSRGLRALKEAAKASPEMLSGDQSILTRTIGDLVSGMMMGEIPFVSSMAGGAGPMAAGRESRSERLAISALRSQALAAGVSEKELLEAQHGSYGTADYQAEYVNRVQALIAGKGGDTSIRTESTMSRLADAVEKSNRLEEARQKGITATPNPLPVRPLAADVGR